MPTRTTKEVVIDNPTHDGSVVDDDFGGFFQRPSAGSFFDLFRANASASLDGFRIRLGASQGLPPPRGRFICMFGGSSGSATAIRTCTRRIPLLSSSRVERLY